MTISHTTATTNIDLFEIKPSIQLNALTFVLLSALAAYTNDDTTYDDDS